jgi:hypothetical protein
MKNIRFSILSLCAFAFFTAAILLAGPSMADTLTLSDGQVLQGKLISRTDKEVVFSVGGQELKFDPANVSALNLDMGGGAAPAAAAPAPAPAPVAPAPAPAAAPAPAPAAPARVTVAAGTRVTVRTSETLDSRKTGAGHKFTSRLEADLVSNGVVVAPAGATVYGQITNSKKAGRAVGNAEMSLTFTDITIDGQMKPIMTTGVTAVTESTTRTSAKRTVGAAAIGGLIGGSSGAKTGAKVGAGASILTSGNQINIPSGTMLEFRFQADFTP